MAKSLMHTLKLRTETDVTAARGGCWKNPPFLQVENLDE